VAFVPIGMRELKPAIIDSVDLPALVGVTGAVFFQKNDIGEALRAIPSDQVSFLKSAHCLRDGGSCGVHLGGIGKTEGANPHLAWEPAVPWFGAGHGVHEEVCLKPTIVVASEKLGQRSGPGTATSALLDESVPNGYYSATSLLEQKLDPLLPLERRRLAASRTSCRASTTVGGR
jgi:hypothetical protein